MSTIVDVARRAGVAASTVSRVIAGSPRISPATQARVRQAMAELDYHPNMIARSLVRRSSRTLGLILSRSIESSFANPFFPEIIRGISAVARRRHYSLLLSTSDTPQEERRECLSMLNGHRVDGVILLASRVRDPLIMDLLEQGHPFVVVGRVPGRRPVPAVNNDNVRDAARLVRHLFERGRREIALINGAPGFILCHDRAKGYRRAHREAGVPLREDRILWAGFTQEAGYDAARTLLMRSPRPDGIVAVDDEVALGVYRALAEAGLCIPADVAVAGFNDQPLARLITPALTTVRLPIQELGRRAAELLVSRLSGEEIAPGPVVVETELVVRESTGMKGAVYGYANSGT